MVEVYYKGNKPVIDFDGPFFNEILKVVKSRYFRFDKNSKTWSTSAGNLLSALDDLRDVDELSISDETLSRLEEDSRPAPETKFVRRTLNRDLLIEPPIGDFQVADVSKMLSANRMYNGNEMGLGKTYETIVTLNNLWERGLVDRILVVCVNEVLWNWKRELLRFSRFFNEDEIQIADKNNREPFSTNARVVICSYRTFLLISDHYYKLKYPAKKKSVPKKYRKPTIPIGDWGESRAIILDEAHSIKNDSRQRHVLDLHKEYFEFRYLLSGTPHPNHAGELFYQLKFMDEAIIPEEDYFTFVRRIANVGNRFSASAVNYFYPDKVEEFISSIQRYFIRRYKKDHLTLPDLNVQRVYVPMLDEQNRIYRQLIDSTLMTIKRRKKDAGDEDDTVYTADVYNLFPYISQACDNPGLLKGKIDEESFPDFARMVDTWKFRSHSKLPYLDSIVSTTFEGQDKIIIWSGHPKTLDSLGEYYKKYNPIVIHGETPVDQGSTKAETRDRLLQKFKTDASCKMLLASYIVLGTGVNITEASTNVYFDRSYDLKFWLQSVSRTHRYGQERETMVYLLLLDRTIDLRLDEVLSGKEELNNNLLRKKTLTKEQWLALFQGDTSDRWSDAA